MFRALYRLGPARIRYGLRQIYLRAICYRYAGHLRERTLPKSAGNLTEDSIRQKATASISSAGILFGFVAAALAATAGSEEGRNQLTSALDMIRDAGLCGWLGVLAGILLPYSVAWQERFISMASVERNPGRHRRDRTWFLFIFLLLPALMFLLLPLVYPTLQLYGLFLKSALEVSGLALLVLSLLFLFFSLELYDSAAGWRGGKRLHFHLAGIASHSSLFGTTLALVALSLLLTFLNASLGRVATSLSLLATVSVTEIERNLFFFTRSES